MKMSAFIEENREEIESGIRRVVPNIGKLTKSDIREWIANDEGLYLWARSEGVNV